MNINSILNLESTKQTTASKPSKGNSKTSDTLFQSILGQKSQGRDTRTQAVQLQGAADSANTASKPQAQTPSTSDKPADTNSDISANDVNKDSQPEAAGGAETTAEPTDSADTTDTETVEAEGETGTIKDTADAEDGTDAEAAVNMPFIVIPGPIVDTEVPKTAGPMEMVAAQPVIQTAEAPQAVQTVQTAPEMQEPQAENAQTVTKTAEIPVEQHEQVQVTADPETEDLTANLELDPELAQKLDIHEDHAAIAQHAQVTDDSVQTAAEGHVDEAEHFAAQVVKEAKSLVNRDEEQAAAPIAEDGQPAPEDQAVRPVEAKDVTGEVHEELDTEPEAKDGKTTEDKPAQTQPHQTGTAHVTDGGRVDFRMSAAQPLEAQQVAAPPEPPQVLMNRVVDQVKSVVTPDKTEFFVQLKPDHLGGLSIGLVAEDKGVVAKIMTSSQQVHAALQADMNQMVQMLRDKGINVVQMEVIYDQTANAMSQGQGDNSQQQFGQGHGRSHGRAAEQVDGAVSMYDTLSSYEVLQEQGGSVEYSA